MATLNTSALVIRRADYSDYDRMVTLFTPEYGRIDAIARGCRRPKSPLVNAVEPFTSGEYQLFSFDEVTAFCAEMLSQFAADGIAVIKCGLHASEFVAQDCVGGFYHPAFRELCEGVLFRRRMTELLGECGREQAVFAVHPSCISKAVGHKRANILHFQSVGTAVKIIGDENLDEYQIELRE